MATMLRRILSAAPLCAASSLVGALDGPRGCGLASTRARAGATLAEESNATQRLKGALAPLRPGDAARRAKWVKEEEGWHLLPPRAWPPRQPKAEEVPALRARLVAARCPPAGTAMSLECTRAHFDLATCLVFAAVDAPVGLVTYRSLGTAGDVDAMVAAGVCLVEALGVDRGDEEGLRWLRRAVEFGSAQAQYELATLMYTGGAGLEEDEKGAYKLFQAAASQNHSAAQFMVADCLLEGIGCEADPAQAVPLLLASAETGHRGARQHLRQLLDGKWMGFDGANGPARIVL